MSENQQQVVNVHNEAATKRQYTEWWRLTGTERSTKRNGSVRQ